MKAIALPFEHEDPKNGVASMVDIAFLLLIFFLVATTIVPSEQDLPLKVPQEGTPTEVPPLPILIAVNADGSVWWGEGSARMEVARPGDGRQLGELDEMLRSAVGGSGAGATTVILKVDDEVSQQRFTDVLNVLSASEVENVMMSD